LRMPFVSLKEFKSKFKKGEDTKELLLRKQFTLEKVEKSEEGEDGTNVTFTISTAGVDRDQDTISVDGWQLENYRKNPVVLWAHDGRQPSVAKSISEWVQDQKLKSTAQFTSKDLYPFGHMIGQMYLEGFLNAVSVGFRSLSARWAADEDTRPWGIDYLQQELLEYSCCPVPANPEALMDAKAKGIDLAPMLDWAIQTLDGAKTAITLPQAEKIWELIGAKKTISAPKMEKTTEKSLFLYQKELELIEILGGK
jgi:HK97 family phage prohead protease